MYIDCHAHLRDFNEAHKETIEHALRVAEDSGLSGIFDMSGANGNPPGINRETIEARLNRARACNSRVFYGTYIGITTDPVQIVEAVALQREFFPKLGDRVGVIGLKMFAGKSVGPLSVVEEDKQRLVYKTLAKLRYTGVLAVHCEKEDLMRFDLWNPQNPISHSFARPEASEEMSVYDQIEFANDSGYDGKLHICHVSTPTSVDLVSCAKKGGMKISCGVAPHHLLLDRNIMAGENGIFYKVNPPLRSERTRKELFQQFLDGRVDILETDHAPHTLQEKTEKAMSGIPGLASWPDFIKLLKGRGASPYTINDMAYTNVNRIFGTNITEVNELVKPGAHTEEYVFDAYAKLKGAKRD